MSVYSSWNPNEQEIFAGLTNAKLPTDHYDLGSGITLSSTSCNVFAPYMAGFKDAEPGKFPVPPWVGIEGGFSFKINAELYIPKNIQLFENIDRINTAWLITALLRIRSHPFISLPIISNKRFSDIEETSKNVGFQTLEIDSNNIFSEIDKPSEVTLSSLEWIKENLSTVGYLFNTSSEYAFTLICLDRCIRETKHSLALYSLWGALELLFGPPNDKGPSHFLAVNLATYLLEKGLACRRLYLKVRDLHSMKCRGIWEEISSEESIIFYEVYEILRDVFFKMTERKCVPAKTDLSALFIESIGGTFGGTQ